MKHLSCLKTLLFLSCAALCLHSCSVEEEPPVRGREKSVRLTVDEARRYVESQLAQLTRSTGADESDLLVLGNYSVDWSRAESSVGDVLYSVDVPAEGAYSYCSVVFDSVGNPVLTPMYHKLVVVKDGQTEALESYIRFYIPTPEHALAHAGPYYDALLNSDVKGDFTGMSLYTTLDGFPVCAGRYADGALQDSGFLGDTLHTVEENAVKIANLLDGVLAARISNSVTRGVPPPPPVKGDSIAPIDILPDDYQWVGENWELLWSHSGGGGMPKPDPLDDDKPSGGGSGNKGDNPAGADDSSGRYAKNKHIATEDQNIMRLLDSIASDCMGELLISTLSDDVTIVRGSTYGAGALAVQPVFGDDGVWTGNNYRIEIAGYLDISLIEELIHLHQHSGKSPDAVRSYRMNNEIEAKLGWYMYRQRIKKMNEDMKPALGGKSGLLIFGELDKNYNANDMVGTDFYNTYMSAVAILRPGYPEDKYPFSESRMTFTELMELMKDC